MIIFVVYGIPQPAGSKRAFPIRRAGGLGVAVTDANPKSRDWKNAVRSAAAGHYQGPLLRGPIRLTATFFVARPKGHFRTGKNCALLREGAPVYPVTKPDCLKLGRAIEDALTGLAWQDDAQNVDLCLFKRYGEPARVEIKIEEL